VDVASITGTGSLANNQVSVTTTSATVVAARAGRRALLIVQHGTTDVYLGTGTVTTTNGLLLKGVAGGKCKYSYCCGCKWNSGLWNSDS